MERLAFCFGRVFLLMFLFVWAAGGKGYEPRYFNVMNYGAVADGKTDNSQVSSSF